MIAVATAPSTTARQRLSVRLPSHFRSVSPPTAWISRLNASRPYRNNTIAEMAANRNLRLDIRQLGGTLLPQQFHSQNWLSGHTVGSHLAITIERRSQMSPHP